MIPFLKRYSTYANIIMAIVAGLIGFVPALNLEPTTNAYVMLSLNLLVAVCQLSKQAVKT